jgi:hypothetical protein
MMALGGCAPAVLLGVWGCEKFMDHSVVRYLVMRTCSCIAEYRVRFFTQADVQRRTVHDAVDGVAFDLDQLLELCVAEDTGAASCDILYEYGGITVLVERAKEYVLQEYLASSIKPAGSGIRLYLIAHTLYALTVDNDARCDAVREAGGIGLLITLVALHSGQHVPQFYAACALEQLADNSITSCDAIREEGGIEALVGVLVDGDVFSKPDCADALASMLEWDDNYCEPYVTRNAVFQAGAIRPLVGMLSAIKNRPGGCRTKQVERKWSECEERCRASACWVLSEMARDHADIQAAIRKHPHAIERLVAVSNATGRRDSAANAMQALTHLGLWFHDVEGCKILKNIGVARLEGEPFPKRRVFAA